MWTIQTILANIDNYKQALELLEGYEYVESLDIINKREYIMMVNGDQFFDIKARYLGTFFKYNEKTNKMCIKGRVNRFYEVLPERAFFRKINKNDKLKIALVEAIDMIKQLSYINHDKVVIIYKSC